MIPKEMMKNQTWEVYDYNHYNMEYNQMVRFHLEKREREEKTQEIYTTWRSFSETMGKKLEFPIYRGEYLAVQIHENTILQEIIEKLQTDTVKDEKAAVIQESPTVSMIFHGLSYMDNLCMSLSRRMGNIWKTSSIRGSIRREYESLLEDLSERQKYQLIYSRVMLQNPQIVYCIKPFKGADLAHRIHIWKLLEMLLDRGITVVDISLNLSDSLSLADRLLMIEHDGTVREIPKENFAFVPRNVPWRTFYRGSKAQGAYQKK